MPDTKKKGLRMSGPGSDYALANLGYLAREAINALCAYMQQYTPYGPEYLAAIESYAKMLEAMDDYSEKLQATAELRARLQAEKGGN